MLTLKMYDEYDEPTDTICINKKKDQPLGGKREAWEVIRPDVDVVVSWHPDTGVTLLWSMVLLELAEREWK